MKSPSDLCHIAATAAVAAAPALIYRRAHGSGTVATRNHGDDATGVKLEV